MLHISSHTEEKSVSPLIRGLICFLLGLTAAVFLVDTFCLAISDQAESGIEDRLSAKREGWKNRFMVCSFSQHAMNSIFGVF
jgi:hypothetical protein